MAGRSTFPDLARVVRREVRAWRRRPLEPALLLVLPLATWAFFLALLAAGTPTDLPIAVVDLDRSATSRRLARALDATPSLRVAATPDSTATAAAAARAGQVYGVVTVPAGFERDIGRGAPPTLVIDYNAQWLLPGSLVRRDARAAATDLAAALEAARAAARAGSWSARPPAEPVAVDAHALFNPQLNYAHFLLPALLPAMLQLFVLLQTVSAVGRELRHRTAGAWLDAAGGRTAVALAGKLLVPGAWFAALAGGMLVVVHRVAGVPMHGSVPLLLAAALVFVLGCQAVGVLLVSWTANLRLATSVAAFYGGVAFAFAGVTFPLGGMPWAARAWADLLPLTHFVALAFEQAMRAAPARESMPELGALALLVLVPLALASLRLGHVLRDERWWGRR